jgi:hypothetical protein
MEAIEPAIIVVAQNMAIAIIPAIRKARGLAGAMPAILVQNAVAPMLWEHVSASNVARRWRLENVPTVVRNCQTARNFAVSAANHGNDAVRFPFTYQETHVAEALEVRLYTPLLLNIFIGTKYRRSFVSGCCGIQWHEGSHANASWEVGQRRFTCSRPPCTDQLH